MTLSKYRYDLSQPQGKAAWLTKGWARAVLMIAGVGMIGIGLFLTVRTLRNGDWGGASMIIVNLLLGGINLQLLSNPRFQRRFGQYVEISLREVTWRLTDPDALTSRRQRLALADIRDARVELMRIRFVTRDGRLVDLPLGALPYEVVRALKERFEGPDSFRAAFGGQLARRRTTMPA